LIEMEDFTRKTLVKSEVINATVKLSHEDWEKKNVGESLDVYIPDTDDTDLEFLFEKTKEGKVNIRLALLSTKNFEEDLERKVSINVKDSCKTICSADLYKVENSIFLAPKSDEIHLHFMFTQLMYLEATITTTARNHRQAMVRHQFVQNLSKLRSAENLSDVKVICKGKVFPCHKLVLSAQSPVLKTFLTGDTKENRENRIVIKDSTPNAVELMLDYLYTGDVPIIAQDVVRDLLQLCDKYELLQLKEVCGESIVDNMTADNFFVAFTEIDRYFGVTSKFGEEAKKFLKSNHGRIGQNKAAWLTFIKKFPELSHEVFISLA